MKKILLVMLMLLVITSIGYCESWLNDENSIYQGKPIYDKNFLYKCPLCGNVKGLRRIGCSMPKCNKGGNDPIYIWCNTCNKYIPIDELELYEKTFKIKNFYKCPICKEADKLIYIEPEKDYEGLFFGGFKCERCNKKFYKYEVEIK